MQNFTNWLNLFPHKKSVFGITLTNITVTLSHGTTVLYLRKEVALVMRGDTDKNDLPFAMANEMWRAHYERWWRR
jgi:hypothetical protein